MATFMAEAHVSESVKLLLDKIVSSEFVDFFRSTKLDYALLERLRPTLLNLQAVLNDAAQKQITNDAVKDWLVMLQDAVYDAEHLFDEINTSALRCQVEAENEGQSASSKVWNFLSSYFNWSYDTINSEMQTLLERLESFAKKGHLLGLRVGVSNSVWHGTPTSSVEIDESTICGRDNDSKKLKNFLLSEDAREGDDKIGVVSIVGMGGLGKTTIAKLLLNDPEVKQKFNLKAWANISKDFDVLKLTTALLECITEKRAETNNLNTLQVKLQKKLNGKIFLLVLDDIWDVDYVAWNSLKNIFNVGEVGSRIVITTRNQRDALTMKTFLPIYDLEPLESEDCWSLLAKHAFGARNYPQCFNLEEVGREIAKKCDGLPLAAVALEGLLRTKLSLDPWNNVLKSDIWELENIGVKPALLLSYHYLPAPLKRCFSYSAIFPKMYELKKEMVVQIWIAEGLVLHTKGEKSCEEVAEEYFDELVSRSMIHRRLDEQKKVESLERVRHLSYNRNADNSYNKFDRLCGLNGLHTFFSLPLQEKGLADNCMSDKAVGDLLLEMEHLHLLSLSHCTKITKVPASMGNLIYLRYLNLSATSIVRLPSETCKLVNLQTLLVSSCRRLLELPEDMGKLVSLRNLDVSDTPLRGMPVQIGKLKTLQTLSNFIVSKQCDGLKVGELGKLPHLRGNLSISGLQNVIDPSDASQANLETKTQIDKLKLDWRNPAPSDSNLQIQSIVLERLQPAVNLKSLTIDSYGGTSFPNWLGDSSYGNMVYMKISYCDNCSQLPPLGQLGNLKELFVDRMKSVKSIGAEFYGSGGGPWFQPFPSLETLAFYDMQKWEEWNLIGGTTTEFPVLRSLKLSTCQKLKGNIPTNLPSLTKLELWECPLLVEPWSSDDNINDCETMKFITHNYTSLESLKIFTSCHSMTSLTLGTFPALKKLTIIGCGKLSKMRRRSKVSPFLVTSQLWNVMN